MVTKQHGKGDHHHKGHLVDVDQGELKQAVFLDKIGDSDDQVQTNLVTTMGGLAVVLKIDLADDHRDNNYW